MIQAIIYVRVSSRKQEEEGSGLQSQEDVCRAFANRKGLQVAAVYSDTYTGGSLQRDGLTRLIKHVRRERSKKFVVIFDDISRLNRDLKGHLEIRETLRKAGCLLMSPSREFKDDADSILVENLLASMAQHHRMKNSEQVVSRMKGRLLGGYWPFRLPYGLVRKRIPGKGHIITSAEPHFRIVREALEGYAVGRFGNHAELQRWLANQPPFVKYHKARSVTVQRVERMLRNPLYAGHLAYPEWGVSLSRADVPSAISLELHQRILRKLDNAKGGERLNRTPDFPARGFLACADCGDLMTACWSKGKKELYPYYLCKNHGCFSRRKSVPREAIHDGIERLLEELVPSQEALAVFEAFVEAAILRLSSNAIHDRDDLKRQISALSDQHRRLLDRIVAEDDTDIVIALKARLKELQLDLKVKEAQHAKLSTATQVTPKMFEHSRAFLANPLNIWRNGNLETRRTLLRACFASPPRYSRNRGFRTPETTLIFKALDAASEGEL